MHVAEKAMAAGTGLVTLATLATCAALATFAVPARMAWRRSPRHRARPNRRRRR
jgi:hypothetical protein